MNELQTIELSILRDFDVFCQEHSLRYFLSEGTLLGALRHQGFIPWDDDVDVMMPRQDYERFLELAPQGMDMSRYQIQHASTIDNYWSPFAKLRLLQHDNSYVQAHIAHLTDANGPLLDIFPLDSVPKPDSFVQRLNGQYCKFLRKILLLKLRSHKPDCLRTRVMMFVVPLYSVRGILSRLDRLFQRLNKETNQFLINWGSYYPAHKQTFLYSDVISDKLRLASFEGQQFPVPAQAEKVLRQIYGDYMTLPPESERGMKRHF